LYRRTGCSITINLAVKDHMAEDDSPPVARRSLRKAREAGGHTQSEVAEGMECSPSKVIRIENGNVTIAANDLRRLPACSKVKDRARVADLIKPARLARMRAQRAWCRTPDHRERLNDPLFEYETQAIPQRMTVLLDQPMFCRLMGGPAVLRAHLPDQHVSSRRDLTPTRTILLSTAGHGKWKASWYRMPVARDSADSQISGKTPTIKKTRSPLSQAASVSRSDHKSLCKKFQRNLNNQTSKLTRKVRVNSRGDPVDRRTMLRSVLSRDHTLFRGPPGEAVRWA
jgi:transcriptional regulator with XRE-family HTH domain